MGALIIRIGFWGTSFYNYDKEPLQKKTKKLILIMKAPTFDCNVELG